MTRIIRITQVVVAGWMLLLFSTATSGEPPNSLPNHGAIPIFNPNAVFPFELWRAGVSGVATVECEIDAKGKVVGARLIEASRPEFGASALNRIKEWKFEPAVKEGAPVSSTMVIDFPFRNTHAKKKA